jgi:hypothetical protein
VALKPRARQERLAMARRFEAGDLTKSKLCRREGISGCKLKYWLKNLEAEPICVLVYTSLPRALRVAEVDGYIHPMGSLAEVLEASCL